MSLKKIVKDQCDSCCNTKTHTSNGSAVYGIGLIGAAVYFFSHATGFTGYVMALLKTIAWPALLVHQALTFLNM